MGTAGPQPQAPDLSDLELAAEVRQCPLTSGVQLIKSRDPHLAGGERNTIDNWLVVFTTLKNISQLG